MKTSHQMWAGQPWRVLGTLTCVVFLPWEYQEMRPVGLDHAHVLKLKLQESPSSTIPSPPEIDPCFLLWFRDRGLSEAGNRVLPRRQRSKSGNSPA